MFPYSQNAENVSGHIHTYTTINFTMCRWR